MKQQVVVKVVATLLLTCDVILCLPIEIAVSDNSVYGSGNSDGIQQQQTEQKTEEKEEFLKISLLEPSDKTRESVNLESEAIPSKLLTKYDKTQKKLAEFKNAVPLLDTISESEKYGNNGDMFDGISRAIVNGYEAFSNFINKLIGKPKEVGRSVSKGITEQLDRIGAKLVGL